MLKFINQGQALTESPLLVELPLSIILPSSSTILESTVIFPTKSYFFKVVNLAPLLYHFFGSYPP